MPASSLLCLDGGRLVKRTSSHASGNSHIESSGISHNRVNRGLFYLVTKLRAVLCAVTCSVLFRQNVEESYEESVRALHRVMLLLTETDLNYREAYRRHPELAPLNAPQRRAPSTRVDPWPGCPPSRACSSSIRTYCVGSFTLQVRSVTRSVHASGLSAGLRACSYVPAAFFFQTQLQPPWAACSASLQELALASDASSRLRHRKYFCGFFYLQLPPDRRAVTFGTIQTAERTR